MGEGEERRGETWTEIALSLRGVTIILAVSFFSLSPPQRPLSCCFVRKGGPGPGEREKRQRAGNVGKGKERREASAIFCAVGWLDLRFGLFKSFPWGASLCGGESSSVPSHNTNPPIRS